MRLLQNLLVTCFVTVLLFAAVGCEDGPVDPDGNEFLSDSVAIDTLLLGTWDWYVGFQPLQQSYLAVTESSISIGGQSLCSTPGVDCWARQGQIFTVADTTGGPIQKSFLYDYSVSETADTVYIRDDNTANATEPRRGGHLVRALVKSGS
jgi:hypothetical protein